MSNAELVELLCLASVALREARRVHLGAYGVLIPHVFMADVLKRVGECLATHGGTIADVPEIRAILEAIELGMAEGDRETRNVIAISFTRDSEIEIFFQQLLPLLGPRTRTQLAGR
jgi:hypothetical protein